MVRFIGSVVIYAILSCAGCGDGRCRVAGEVSYDGETVADGEISFIPNDSRMAPEGGLIRNGRYDVRIRPGAKKVAIRGTKALPRHVPADATPQEAQKAKLLGTRRADYIPEKYNRNTVLTADIPATGKSDLRFALTSK